MFLASLTLLSALALSVIAGVYSILGLMTIFSGAKVAVAIMGTVMEIAKIITALWLHKHWRLKGTRMLRSYLITATIVLMTITSIGIFGFLSKGHIENTRGSVSNDAQIVFLEEKLESLANDKARNLDILAVLDKATQEYIDRGYISKGLAKREEQKEEREIIEKSIADVEAKQAEIRDKVFVLESENLDVELEVGPIKYVADMIYSEGAEAENLEKAVRILILSLIFVFDPLAILLLIAAQKAMAAQGVDEVQPVEEDPEPLVEPPTAEEKIKIEKRSAINKKKTRTQGTKGNME